VERPVAISKSGKLVRRLVLVAVGMFGFGFAMVPLYGVFCDFTGLGGRGIKIETGDTTVAHSDRTVKIRFDATVNSSLPWAFQAKQKVDEVRLGEPSKALYIALNQANETNVGQATYNVTPPEASLYFVKTECFCFTEQILQAKETKEMPVYFYIQPDLPAYIKEIALSYTFYKQEQSVAVTQVSSTASLLPISISQEQD
jgi:cytochrome c oxidase assembly protein subunit 11